MLVSLGCNLFLGGCYWSTLRFVIGCRRTSPENNKLRQWPDKSANISLTSLTPSTSPHTKTRTRIRDSTKTWNTEALTNTSYKISKTSKKQGSPLKATTMVQMLWEAYQNPAAFLVRPPTVIPHTITLHLGGGLLILQFSIQKQLLLSIWLES